MDNITKIRVSNPIKIFVYETQEPILHHMSNSLEKSHMSTVRYAEKNQIIDSISKENPKVSDFCNSGLLNRTCIC